MTINLSVNFQLDFLCACLSSSTGTPMSSLFLRMDSQNISIVSLIGTFVNNEVTSSEHICFLQDSHFRRFPRNRKCPVCCVLKVPTPVNHSIIKWQDELLMYTLGFRGTPPSCTTDSQCTVGIIVSADANHANMVAGSPIHGIVGTSGFYHTRG